MRKSYELEGSSPTVSPLAGDMAYTGYMELTRSSGRARAKLAYASTTPTILVEPNTLLREGLRRILSETPYEPVAFAATLSDLQEHWLSERRCLLIIDASSDHGGVCREIREFRQQHTDARIVFLVDAYEAPQVLEAYQAGADAYLLKSVSCDVLMKTLDLVMLGEAVFPSAILEMMPASHASPEAALDGEQGEDRQLPKGLSVRETVILRCLMEGASNKLIARKFDITEATVKVHVKAILRKIRAKNRTQAAIWAASHLPPGSRASAN